MVWPCRNDNQWLTYTIITILVLDLFERKKHGALFTKFPPRYDCGNVWATISVRWQQKYLLTTQVLTLWFLYETTAKGERYDSSFCTLWHGKALGNNSLLAKHAKLPNHITYKFVVGSTYGLFKRYIFFLCRVTNIFLHISWDFWVVRDQDRPIFQS